MIDTDNAPCIRRGRCRVNKPRRVPIRGAAYTFGPAIFYCQNADNSESPHYPPNCN